MTHALDEVADYMAKGGWEPGNFVTVTHEDHDTAPQVVEEAAAAMRHWVESHHPILTGEDVIAVYTEQLAEDNDLDQPITLEAEDHGIVFFRLPDEFQPSEGVILDDATGEVR